MTRVLAHSETPLTRGLDEYIGSPMYAVLPEHGMALLGFFGLLVATWWVRRRARRDALRPDGTMAAWLRLAPEHRFLAWLLTASAVIHLGLTLGHEPSGLTLLYAIAGVAFARVARRLVAGRPWRRWTRLILVGSLLGYAVSSMAGGSPDQVGMSTKLIELTALAIAATPLRPGRWRRLAASTGTVLAVAVVGIGAWIGALGAGEGGHHHGEVPPPGVLLPVGDDRPATAQERAAAEALHAATVTALSRWHDPAAAAADGFQTDGIRGLDFHAPNPRFQNDGVVLDPSRPEHLVYALGPDGPVLIGAMFEMEGIGVAGPAVGGPMTVWHAHDHICVTPAPPSIAGLVSPYGACPLGAIAVPITHEMLHVWVVPEAPEEFGDLDEGWLRAYLNGELRAGG